MKIKLCPMRESDLGLLYELFQSIPLNENGFENSAFGLSETEFAQWVKEKILNSTGKNLKEGYVPQTMYILWVDNIPVGISKLRHWLTPALEQHGGHIGYAISPKFRNKGYGKIIISETLKFAKEMKIEKVLLIVNDDNVPSYKAIECNHGVLTKTEIDQKDGCLIRFYWITL